MGVVSLAVIWYDALLLFRGYVVAGIALESGNAGIFFQGIK